MNSTLDASHINQHSTTFEHFPPEIFHLIFDYLTGDDVLRSFFLLNRRLNSIIETYCLNTIGNSKWTRRELIVFFKDILNRLSTHRLSLSLTNKLLFDGHCSANIEFLFSSLLDYNQLTYLVNNLQQLIFVRPIVDVTICLPDVLIQNFIVYSFDNRIIFRRHTKETIIDSILLCSNEIMRSLLVDHGGMYSQILMSYRNPIVSQLVCRVRHLKLYIDTYNQQRHYLSSLIVDTLLDLTVIIIDDAYQDFSSHAFHSLVSHMPHDCRLHFYIKSRPKTTLSRTVVDGLVLNYRDEFYIKHQADVTITYSRTPSFLTDAPLLIYTLPFCAHNITLIDNVQIIADCFNFMNLTQIVFDPCFLNYFTTTPSTTLMNCLSNLSSLELVHTARTCCPSTRILNSYNGLMQLLVSNIHHMHLTSNKCSVHLKKIMPLYSFQNLQYLDITDNDSCCKILSDILEQCDFCTNILHLNINGRCHVDNTCIKKISERFSKVQTLKFPMKFSSLFSEQLDAIGQFILIRMRSHLHYLHVYFQHESLLIMPLIPSEHQLSEWLGYNQKRLSHIQAIELNRNELSAWM